jgi:hypothetical protein
MVGSKKSKDELVGSLVGLVDSNAALHELYRVNHESNAIEELPLSCLFEDISIKELFVGLGNDIPGLDRSLVAVIKRVEPKVLHMPAEGRKLHTHIDPRDGDSTNFLIVVLAYLENGARRLIHVIEVIKAVGIVKMLVSRSETLMKGKSRPIAMDW